jgi:prepilin-type N-terminal cleavage/methylation domain-containing protein
MSARYLRPRSAGFSLIEVLVVVMILGILVSVGGTAIGRQVARDRVLRASTVVEGMLVEATQLAVRRRRPMRVDIQGNALRIVDRDSSKVVKSRGFGAGSDLNATLTLSPPTGVTIFPNGRADAALTVTLSGEGLQYVVGRSATGIVRRQ